MIIWVLNEKATKDFSPNWDFQQSLLLSFQLSQQEYLKKEIKPNLNEAIENNYSSHFKTFLNHHFFADDKLYKLTTPKKGCAKNQ